MLWNDTFGLYGKGADEVAGLLDFEKIDAAYKPLSELPPELYSVLYESTGCKYLMEAVQKSDLIGAVVLDSQPRSGPDVFNRKVNGNGERSYQVRLTEPLKYRGLNVDILVVKRWSNRHEEDAKTEFEMLMKVNNNGYQNPTTIPVAVVRTPDGVQLIKIKEPCVTYNDLPQVLEGNPTEKVEEVYRRATLECFSNWAKLAANNLFQLSMIPVDHQNSGDKKQWRFGISETRNNVWEKFRSGEFRYGIAQPSNAGFLNTTDGEVCIVRDLEHLRTKEWIINNYRLPDEFIPVKNANMLRYGVGTPLCSMLLMSARVGSLLGIDEGLMEKTMKDGLEICYNWVFKKPFLRNLCQGYRVKGLDKIVANIRKNTHCSELNSASIEYTVKHFLNGCRIMKGNGIMGTETYDKLEYAYVKFRRGLHKIGNKIRR